MHIFAYERSAYGYGVVDRMTLELKRLDFYRSKVLYAREQ
jgi:hypothetical protein